MTEATIEAACAHVLVELVRTLDGPDRAAALAFFTDDAAWCRNGAWSHGQDEIRAALSVPRAHTAQRHLLANVLIRTQSVDLASGEADFTLYRGTAGKPGLITEMAGIGGFTVHFRREAAGWRVAVLEGRPVLVFPREKVF
ncbi:nuclear transport factor 2 family protein [Acidocella sp.]|uniref:nuclear transport factor 2 family protein n=1 Tax=Acidocella sp. TaxID=50710 RepID=UPI003D02DDA8